MTKDDNDNEKSAPAIKRLTVDLPEDLHIRVKSGCAERGISMNDLIRQYLMREFPPAKK